MDAAVHLIPRGKWGARRARKRVILPVEEVRGVALHYSASQAPTNHAQCFASVRWIQDFHMDEKGWLDGAYSHVVCRHGFTFQMRGIGYRTAANGTTKANDNYYAVCVLGTDNKDRADITPELRRELNRLFTWYERRIPGNMIVKPHSAFVSTSCPGDELRNLIVAAGWDK